MTVRIIAIADTFDALTSNRVYRNAVPLERALSILQEEGATGSLDADLVELALPFLSAWSVPGARSARQPVGDVSS